MTTYDIAPVLVTPPTGYPVGLLEARQHLREPDHRDDPLILACIAAATKVLDGWTGQLGRCIMTQTWRQDMATFSNDILLPMKGIQNVTVGYSDTDNVAQTVSSSNYHLVVRHDGTHLELASSGSWPSVYDRPDAVRISMVCGAATAPDDIKAAILLHVGLMYENREAVAASLIELPLAYRYLIGNYQSVAF